MTTKKDIVSRLRECDQGLLDECQEPELAVVTDCSSIAEAANLIEQLREERDQLRKERDDAQLDQRLIDELWQRRTDASETSARIRQLLGNAEQLESNVARLESTVARLREDLRRMDAIVTLGFVNIEKRKLRGWDFFDKDNHNA